MGGPRTAEEAMALSEINLFESGIFLGGAGIDGDRICAFVDSDGVSKKVECIRRSSSGPDEWVKIRL